MSAPKPCFVLAALALAAPALAQQQTPTAKPRQLDAITVTARKPKIQTLTDRTVYDVKADLQATAGTAVDVLQNVPSVEVDADGAVTLRGDSNVTVLIDGKPSAQFAGSNAGLGLQELQAADIDRIEVMTNPPARYKADGSAGVINIITRKQRRSGLSGQAQASFGDDGRYQGAVSVSYTAGRLTLTGGLSARKDFRRRIVTDARTATDPASGQVLVSQERLDEGLRRTYGQVKGGLEYQARPRTSFGGSFSHQEVQGPRDFLQTDSAQAADGTPVSASQRISVGREWDRNADEEAHLDQKLAGGTLTLTLKRTTTHEREHYADFDTTSLPPAPPDLEHLNLTLNVAVDEASAEFERPLPHDGTLRLGYDFEADDNSFHNYGDVETPPGAPPVPDTQVTYDFGYRQQIHAGYGELSLAPGKWTIDAGLRAEATHYSTSLDVGGFTDQRSYFRLYPSLRLERSLSAATKLTFDVARRVNRPNPEALNPFVDYQDRYNLRAGNADLLPEDIWSYEAGWRWDRRGWSAGATAYYRFSRDAVTDVIEPVSGNVVLATKANLPKSKSGGLELTGSGHLARQLTFNLSANLFHNQIDVQGLGLAGGLRSTTGFNAKASLEWKPEGDDTLQVSFSRSDRRLTPQGSIGAINLVNFGWRRRLSRDLALVATFSDAFNGQRFRRYVTTPVLLDAYQRYQPGEVAWVGVVWTFGGKKPAKQDFEYDQP